MRIAIRPWIMAALAAGLFLPSVQQVRADEKVAAENAKADQSGTIAVFTLGKPLTEKPAAEDMPFLTGSVPDSFLSMTARMKRAAGDDEVKAVVLLMSTGALGVAQTEELQRVISEIKDAGKPVYAHADLLTTRQMMILSAASQISVSPTGYLFMTGLYGEQLFLRGLLDKLKITPEFITMGAYKSAAETFMRTSPSPEAAKMNNWVFDGLFESTVQAIADGRGVKPGQVKKWIDFGLYSAKEAKEAGIIDHVQYRQDFVTELKKKHGSGIEFNKRYGKKSQQQIDFSNPFAALQLWAQILAGPSKKKSDKDAVAVVYVEGAIYPGSPAPSLFGESDGAFSTPIRKALDKAAEDDSVKAVVLRVNSPGGSVVASEIILDATRRVKAKKPIVISMGNVAASGGYYVSCAADTIFAEPGTITGSIGVLSGKFVTTKMWDSIGINFTPLARGAKSGMLGSYAPFTDAERARMTEWMEDVYGQFKGHVTAIRGDRLKKPIDDLAAGRVWTGRQAHEHGLVDELGGLNEAIAFIADEAKVDDYEVRVIPRPKNFMEMLTGDLSGGSNKKTKNLSLEASFAQSELWKAALPMLEGLDPQRVAAVRQAFEQLEIVRREQISLTMPIIVTE